MTKSKTKRKRTRLLEFRNLTENEQALAKDILFGIAKIITDVLFLPKIRRKQKPKQLTGIPARALLPACPCDACRLERSILKRYGYYIVSPGYAIDYICKTCKHEHLKKRTFGECLISFMLRKSREES